MPLRPGARSMRGVLRGNALAYLLLWAACREFSTLWFMSFVSPTLVRRHRDAGPDYLVQRYARYDNDEDLKANMVINDQIRSAEVRVLAEVSDDPKLRNQTIETNYVLSTRDALQLAQDRGVDLILVKDNADPPCVKLMNVGKYVYQERRKKKELTKKGKAPKQKEVKLSYTIGIHDLDTNIRKMEKWLKGKRQTIKVTVVMKGRTRMFEKQARELLNRVRREIVAYGKAAGADKGDPITKDGRGDLVIMLSSGPDMKLLKEMKLEAEAAGLEAGDEDDDEEEEGEDVDDDEADIDPKIKADLAEVEKELAEMKAELLDCGLKPGELGSQPEIVDIVKRLNELKSKAAA